MGKKYNFDAYRSMKKVYKYVKLLKDGRVKILTPVPYIIKHFDRENIDDVLYMYNEDVKFLFNCLSILGITKKEAIDKEYTLNKYTGDELYLRALNSDKISHSFTSIIFKHNW